MKKFINALKDVQWWVTIQQQGYNYGKEYRFFAWTSQSVGISRQLAGHWFKRRGSATTEWEDFVKANEFTKWEYTE